jgi:hypothetical protein
MDSILQKDRTICFLCRRNPCGDPLDKHHCFFGAMRSKSEKYGLTVYLHHNTCHIFGKNAVHKNARINKRLQAYAQKKAMQVYGWSVDDFRSIFRKNHLEEE